MTSSSQMQLPQKPDALRTAILNVRKMHFLARLAKRFNDAGVPLMVLKGAALHMTIYERPEQRSMCDLDLLIRPQDVDRAFQLLEEACAYRSQVLLREDFFPKFYYEAEYTAGDVLPVVMDVHIRPFRPLRYAQLVPDDALWDRAQSICLGDATINVPCPEDMLIHLAAHCAIHGGASWKWREDIRRWVAAYTETLDWDLFIQAAKQWRLTLPVLQGIAAAQGSSGNALLPKHVHQRMKKHPVNWRDQLALWQAPRDDYHPIAHAIVNVLTTPGVGFVASYFQAVFLPGREHMRQWYPYEHIGWLPTAHVCRILRPITNRLRWLWRWSLKHEVITSEDGSQILVACRDITPGTAIGSFGIKAASGNQNRDITLHQPDGPPQRHSMTGKMRFIGTDERPNAKLEGMRVIALRHIRPGDSISIAPERETQIHRKTRKRQILPQAA